MSLEGSRALVTGGSSGIGAAVVRALMDRGVRVAVLDLNARSDQGDLAIPLDVADERAVVAAVSEVVREFGGLDLAVLNAGTGGFSPLVDMTSEEWDRIMNVNLRGTFLCLRESARAMTASIEAATSGGGEPAGGGGSGAIVATSSISGSSAERGMGHYAVSKAGISQMVRVAARELGPAGIRVNAVAPGTTATPLFEQTKTLPGYWDRLSERTPIGGIGTAEEVAAVVVALLELTWVTGQIVAADGGISLWSPIDPTESLEG